jgi:hypothetical protein
MSEISADAPHPAPPPPAVLEYRRVEPLFRHVSDRARRNLIGGLSTVALFFAFLIGMTCQWNFPHDQQARNVDRWLENELERRIYERDYRKGMASGTPPAVAMPVVVRPWASALMTVTDAALLMLALFAHRLVRKLDDLKRTLILTPSRIWKSLLTLAAVQLLLALACVGADAWRIFSSDFIFVGWTLLGLLTAEFLCRIVANASLPEVLQRRSFVLQVERTAQR